MHISKSYLLLCCLGFSLFFGACLPDGQQDATTSEHTDEKTDASMDWTENANIYEVNIRQYTPEGTLAAFEQHLPRLKDMGVKILWFMPIYPISEARRKGGLGSYYAISDYTAVNPNFGTMAEFKALVEKIHEMDMKVLLDWVPNHTGWDHHWITEHPDFYTKNEAGEITDPLNDQGQSHGWTDVADLNYDNAAMRLAMIEEMKYWLEEVQVDGFRCDVAYEVPDDFWAQVTAAFEPLGPVFMLAEAERPELRNNGYFQMSYAWSFHHLMNAIAQEKKEATEVAAWLQEDRTKFNKGYHMHFITNHDENSWNGTIEERLGPAADAMAVLAFTFDGMPLIYSGQEAGLNKRLEFFEKDSINWGTFEKVPFYTSLLKLKRENPALWNGEAGGKTQIIGNSNEKSVLVYLREKGENRVMVVLNLSNGVQEVTLSKEGNYAGDYLNFFGNSGVSLTSEMEFQLGPWNYMVLVKN